MGGLEGGSHLLSWGPQRGTPSSNYTPLPHLSAALALQGARALVGQSFARGSASSRLRPRDPLTAGLRAESCGSRTRRRRASARPCSRPRLGRLRLGQVHRRPPPIRRRCTDRQPPAGAPWLRRTPGRRPRPPPPCSPPPWGRVRGGELRFARIGSGSRSSKIAEGGARAAASCPRPSPLAPAACNPTSSRSLARRPLPRTGPPRWDAAPRPLHAAEQRAA